MLGYQMHWPYLRSHLKCILVVTFSACLMLISCTTPSDIGEQPQAQAVTRTPLENTTTGEVAELAASTRSVPASSTSIAKPPTATSLPPSASPTLLPTLSVEQWDSLAAPTPQPEHFWASDQPKQIQPLGFGTLVPDRDAGRQVSVRAYQLAAALPQAPAELDVYLLGDYPRRHFGMHNATLRNKQVQGARSLQGWNFNPEYCLLEYRHPVPLGDQAPIATKEQAEQRARALLQGYGLLMPDAATPTTREGSDGTWTVYFFRQINGIVVYTAQALVVRLNRDGQAIQILGRRRPLLAQSRYPLRSVDEAWQLLKHGRGLPMYVDDLAPGSRGLSGTVDQFVVQTIELAYVETQVFEPRQIMQPYYVFRNEQGYTLYVPAVADPHVQWWSEPAG